MCNSATLKYLLFFAVKPLAEISDGTNQSNLFVGDPIYGVTIDAHVLEGLKSASTRNKIALTLLENFFTGEVLTKLSQVQSSPKQWLLWTTTSQWP